MDKGDYVRIKWGNGLQTISQCKNIVDMGDTQYAKDDFYIHTDHSGEVIYKTMIVKSSPNIMSLIEIGDLINKKEVVKIIHFEGDTFYRIELFGGKAIMNKKDIKSIVTKEQFENMEYKIGE